ncbi:MAG: hypothetical protein ACI85I_002461, partial [Arenicella sp.]
LFTKITKQQFSLAQQCVTISNFTVEIWLKTCVF